MRETSGCVPEACRGFDTTTISPACAASLTVAEAGLGAGFRKLFSYSATIKGLTKQIKRGLYD